MICMYMVSKHLCLNASEPLNPQFNFCFKTIAKNRKVSELGCGRGSCYSGKLNMDIVEHK